MYLGTCTYLEQTRTDVYGTLAEMTGNDWNVPHIPQPFFFAPKKKSEQKKRAGREID